MQRQFTIMENGVARFTRVLDTRLMIVGRSSHADIQVEDPLISRRHLEVRVEDQAVFVQDISSHGSLLNGKRLVGKMSLNSGDVLELGQVMLRYDEAEVDEVDFPSAHCQPSSSSAEMS